MKITLDNFENYVPSKILFRGEAYYDGGAVMNLEETDGVWIFLVYGVDGIELE